MNKNNQEQEENFMTRQEVLMTFAQGAKKILENNLSKLIVYGSYARGDYKENSDIDVMILTPFSKEEIEALYRFTEQVNRNIKEYLND